MNFRHIAVVGIAAILMMMAPWQGQAEVHQLKQSDIKTSMTELLEQHFGGQAITPAILQNGIRLYMEHADPSHIYLLDGESKAFQNLDQQILETAIKQYDQDNYSLFLGLNEGLDQGIARAAKLRHFDDVTILSIFQEARKEINQGTATYTYDPAAFATNDTELALRLREDFVEFVAMQMERFGVDEVMANKDVIVAKYMHHLKGTEDEYADPRTNAESENQFSLHILKALAKSLDPHTSFFDEGEAMDMKLRLEKGFDGIGIVTNEVIDGFVITDLLADAPAIRSGKIKINDRLVKVNGKSVLGLNLNELTHLLHKAKAGDTIALTVQRPSSGAMIDVTLTAETIVVNQGRVETSFEKYGDGIVGTITLHSFYQGPKNVSASQDVADGIAKLQKQGKIVGLVLDLRDNSGGYLTEAVKVAGLFITNGVVVISKYSDGDIHYYRDLYGNQAYNGPLVVLTSRLTASAAEIVAQALQDYGVALVVGDPHTYGKGTIQAQTVTDDKSDSYFKVTVGEFYTVSGRTTQLRGVQADVVLPGEYSQLQIGESYLNSNIITDVVEPAFKDTLADVEPRAKQWYVSNYLPTIQKQETMWQSMLPELKKRSQNRTSSDFSYQNFLKHLADYAPNSKQDAEEGARQAHFDVEAYQVKEASKIVEDMIQLREPLAGKSSVTETVNFPN